MVIESARMKILHDFIIVKVLGIFGIDDGSDR